MDSFIKDTRKCSQCTCEDSVEENDPLDGGAEAGGEDSQSCRTTRRGASSSSLHAIVMKCLRRKGNMLSLQKCINDSNKNLCGTTVCLFFYNISILRVLYCMHGLLRHGVARVPEMAAPAIQTGRVPACSTIRAVSGPEKKYVAT
jgi:hypothetical protein